MHIRRVIDDLKVNSNSISGKYAIKELYKEIGVFLDRITVFIKKYNDLIELEYNSFSLFSSIDLWENKKYGLTLLVDYLRSDSETRTTIKDKINEIGSRSGACRWREGFFSHKVSDLVRELLSFENNLQVNYDNYVAKYEKNQSIIPM